MTDKARARPSETGSHPTGQACSLGPSGFDPSRLLLDADCTGDETLWVARYTFYFQSISGCEMSEAIIHANAAWDAWGNDPDATPEEIASSDYAEMVG